MKHLLPANVNTAFLDAAGNSFSVTLKPIKAASNISLLLSDSTAYNLRVNEANTYNFSLLSSANTSYSLSTSVIEKPVAVADIIDPVYVYTYVTVAADFRYQELSALHNSFSSSYTSGYEVITNSVAQVTFATGYEGITNVLGSSLYLTGTDPVVRDIKYECDISYLSLLTFRTGVSYDIYTRSIYQSCISYNSFTRLTLSFFTSFNSDPDRLTASIGIGYINYELRTLSIPISFNICTSVRASVLISFTQIETIYKTLPVSFVYFTKVVKPVDVAYNINATNRLTKTITIIYVSVISIATVINTPGNMLTLPDGTKVPSGNTILQSQEVDILEVEPLVVIGGELVYATDLTISIDEGNYTYSLDVSLANYIDLVRFEANKEFYVVLQGEIYTFLVDSRAINREEVNAPKATVHGVSPTSRFTSPRSKQILGTTFTEALTAKDIALKVLYDKRINYTIDNSSQDMTQAQADSVKLSWEIDDWGIPPFRYGAENTYPLDAVKNIVEAVGAVIESNPEGDIRVRYKHPVSVPKYSDATTNQFFTDANDIISIQERHASTRMVNAVYVKTYQDMGVQDTIEFFDALTTYDPLGSTNTSGGIVRVFPAVWRDTVDMTHNRTDDPNVILEYQGIEEWTPNQEVGPDYGWETIDIVKGQGSTKYPMTKVLGHGYLSEDAGVPIINDYSKTFYTSNESIRFSIIKLKYQTRCHRWKLVAPGGTHIQFRIYDTVFNTYLR